MMIRTEPPTTFITPTMKKWILVGHGRTTTARAISKATQAIALQDHINNNQNNYTMALCYNGVTMGTVTIRQEKEVEEGTKRTFKYEIQIRQGNCLAVLIHVRKNPDSKGKDDRYIHTLYSFFGDEQHLKNLLKNEGRIFWDEVVSIQLNMYYKECATLLKYMTRAGHKVTCYYKEPKRSEK